MHLLTPLMQLLLLLTTSFSLASPLVARDSSEALGNVQYLTTSWKTYTASLLNISRTFDIPTNPHHHSSKPPFNTSTLPLVDQYAVIAIESSYDMNFKYESYVIARVATGPILGKNDSKDVVKAIKELVRALKPLFEAFEIFVDIVGKDNLGYMLGYQSQIAELISAVEGVVVDREKKAVERQKVKHAKIVVDLKTDLEA